MSTPLNQTMHGTARAFTRVSNPPGGGSSIGFGGNDHQGGNSNNLGTPLKTGKRIASHSNAPTPKTPDIDRNGVSGEATRPADTTLSPPVNTSSSSATKTNSGGSSDPTPSPARTAPSNAPTTSSQPGLGISGLGMSILVVKSAAHKYLVDEVVNNVTKRLLNLNVSSISVLEVHDETSLPAAASQAAKSGTCDAIIAVGALWMKGNPLFDIVSRTVTKELLKLSVATSVPVIYGIVSGNDEDEVKTKILSSSSGAVGTEFANSAVALGRYHVRGGAPSSTSSSTASASGGSEAIIVPSLANAPKSVIDSLDLLKKSLAEHGASGIFGLSRKFRIMDDDGSKSLSLSEFKKAIAEHALNLNDEKIKELFNFFDTDKSGSISYNEFLIGLRGNLNERRKKLVSMAFDVIDVDKSGVLDVNDIAARYDASQHPDVIAGRRKQGEIFREFLDLLDGGEKDGKVSPDEFARYYANVSASIDDDDYFELVIRNAWHISGGEGWCENSTCRRVLVTHADGSQTVQEIKNDIAIKATDKEAMVSNLQNQGVNVSDPSALSFSGFSDQTTPASPASAPPANLAAPSTPSSSLPAPPPASGSSSAHPPPPSSGTSTPSSHQRGRRVAGGGASSIVLG